MLKRDVFRLDVVFLLCDDPQEQACWLRGRGQRQTNAVRSSAASGARQIETAWLGRPARAQFSSSPFEGGLAGPETTKSYHGYQTGKTTVILPLHFLLLFACFR